MKSSPKRSFTGAMQPYSMLCGCIGCVVLVFFLFSCSSIPPGYRDTLIGEENTFPPNCSMIFVIHGDGDYLYHDSRGRAHRADDEALLGAMKVAVRNPQAEVFVFHEQPRRHILFLFPLRDGKFYYYRNGRLLVRESYWRDRGPSRFDPAVGLYQRFRAEEQPQAVRLFLYFGHEIPEFGGAGYDASSSKRTFTVHDLADGLKGFTRDSTKFDLIVLSTCYNGTPHTISAIAPYARTIVASPDNLHLSYLDLHPFERLDFGLRDRDMAAFAKKFASRAFDRLTEELQTSVTVAVYDAGRVQGYVNSVDSVYAHTLAALKGQRQGFVEHCDCAEDSAYVLPGMSEGVDVFYRPPRFGRSRQKQIHSGWECYRLLK
jgi:hypothetical protein